MNKVVFCVGDTVDVPEPKNNDLWQHAFSATVVAIDKENGIVEVVDGEGDYWDVDIDRLE